MKIFINSIKVALIFLILCGVLYPLVGTAFGQLLFNNKANGSIIDRSGKAVGSLYRGQEYTKDYYFKGRPATKKMNDISGGSNTSPNGKDFKQSAEERVDIINSTFTKANKEAGKEFKEGIPRDMVTASGSSYDPNISKKAALYQLSYVSKKSGISEDKLRDAINESSEKYLGNEYVNLLKLNTQIDYLMK